MAETRREPRVGEWMPAEWRCPGVRGRVLDGDCNQPHASGEEYCWNCGTLRPEPAATPSVAVPAEGEPLEQVAEWIPHKGDCAYVESYLHNGLERERRNCNCGRDGMLSNLRALLARPSAGGSEVTEPATWAVWCDGHVCYAPFRTEADAKERLKRCSWPIGENGGGYVAPLYAALASRVAPAAPLPDRGEPDPQPARFSAAQGESE